MIDVKVIKIYLCVISTFK